MKNNNENESTLTYGLISKYRGQIYGFLILWIVFFHLWAHIGSFFKFDWMLINFIKKGSIGVDAFLLLSAISLFFSLKNDTTQTLREFYKKRFTKIFQIYVLICIPYYSLLLLLDKINFSSFVKSLFFLNKNAGSFWFLLVILICYLIYPFLFKLIDRGRTNIIYLSALIYILILIVFAYTNYPAYKYYEILLSRIPVFLIGSTLGEKVYYNKTISPKLILSSVSLLILIEPISFVISRIDCLKYFNTVFWRLSLGLQGFSFIVLFIIIIQYLQKLKITSFLDSLGKITLELYVIHIMIRGIMFTVFNVKFTGIVDIFFISVFYICISIILSYFLNKLLSKKHDLLKFPIT